MRRPSFVNRCFPFGPPFLAPFDFCRLFSNKTSESVSESLSAVLRLTEIEEHY